jgi:hypothetical protein
MGPSAGTTSAALASSIKAWKWATIHAENSRPRKRRRIMPRYFFNTRIGDQMIPDPEGEDLRDPDHAWEVAQAMIRELLRENEHPNLLTAALEVTDEGGEIVLEFPFAEALNPPPDEPSTRH